MTVGWTKGDHVWYRRAGNGGHTSHAAVPAIVLYSTPRRVALEITDPNGFKRIIFAAADNLEPRTEGDPA